VALGERRLDDTIEQAERALALRQAPGLPPGDRALTLSRALIERGITDDHSRARDLASHAKTSVAPTISSDSARSTSGSLRLAREG
jgi:hypothetical protein